MLGVSEVEASLSAPALCVEVPLLSKREGLGVSEVEAQASLVSVTERFS